MSWMRRLRFTIAGRRMEEEIREELDHHLELRRRDALAAEGSADGAERALRRQFGDAERVRERTRDMDILTWLETWLQDVRHAGRMLRRAPGFTAVVVVSLAVGIGANAAIFSLVNAVLLRTLPVPHPEQVFLLSQSDGHDHTGQFSYPVLRQFEQAAGGRAQLGGASSTVPLRWGRSGSGAAPVRTQLVSGGYFPALGLRPWRGRWIEAGDNRSLGGAPVAVLGYAFWMQQFGGDPAMVERTIEVQGAKLTVVGVAPPGFSGLDPNSPAELWVPAMMQPALGVQGNRSSVDGDAKRPWPAQEQILWLTVVARLGDPAAAPALAAAWARWNEQSWERIAPGLPPWRVQMSAGGRGTDGLRQAYGAPLRVLMAMVGLMLLIAVANVATLLLARMVRRRREMAVRVALGVSRARLARQLLTEGLLLALAAGAAAVLVAIWTSQALVRLAADGGAAPFQPDLDWRVWAFLAAVSLLVGVVLGVLPAWAAQRSGPYAELKGAGAPAGGGRVPLGRWLVVAQMALSLLLVVGAGLFGRSLAAMFHLDMGFDRNHVLTLELARPGGAMPTATLAALERRMLQRIEAMPGVRAAALDLNGIDDGSAETSGVSFAGRAQPREQDKAREDTVSRDYFAAVGMHLVRGRSFEASDGPHTTKVVVINQALAQRYYAGQDALGQTFGYDPKSTGDFHIVGVVADARVDGPTTPATPMFYHLLSQTDRTALRAQVRTEGDPRELAGAVRQAVAASAAPLRVRSSFGLAERLDSLLGQERMVAQLSAGLGGLALGLACLGLYGVMAYAVAARAAEFGLRVALGASRGQVVGLVLREVALLLGGGLALGLPLALAAGRWLQPLLPGVRASDPVTLAGAALVMAGLPLLVALHPAWRAARADPTRALRAE